MTAHRDLKKLIRERAARTGESYTTARRHVLARAGRAAALPAGLVPGYVPFSPGLHHDSTLLAHLLRQAGHVAPHTGEPYTETTLCGLAGGVGFLYAVFEYGGLPPILTIVAQHHPQPWVPAALERLGIGFTVAHSSRAPAAEAALDAALAAGRPVLCTVDRGALPWHGPATSLPSDPYPVVVAGRNDDGYLIDDQSAVPRPLAAQQFLAAWAGHRKGRFERLTLDPPGSGAPLAQALRAAIATTAAHLTGPVLGNAFDVNMGLSGMARLAGQLRDDRTGKGWACRFAAPEAFGLAMHRLYECLEVAYTAPSATRVLYADFLDEAARVLDDPRLPRAAALFRESGSRWSAIAASALRAAGDRGELLERRLFLRLTGAGADRLQEIDDRIAACPAAEPDPALFAVLAGQVDAAREAESRAAALLTG